MAKVRCTGQHHPGAARYPLTTEGAVCIRCAHLITVSSLTMIASIAQARTAAPSTPAAPIRETADAVGTIVDELSRRHSGDELIRKLLNIWDLHRQSVAAAVLGWSFTGA